MSYFNLHVSYSPITLLCDAMKLSVLGVLVCTYMVLHTRIFLFMMPMYFSSWKMIYHLSPIILTFTLTHEYSIALLDNWSLDVLLVQQIWSRLLGVSEQQYINITMVSMYCKSIPVLYITTQLRYTSIANMIIFVGC